MLSLGVVLGAGEEWRETVRRLCGDGAAAVWDADGRELFVLRADEPRTPASILKIATALAALELLGREHRFITEFLVTPEGDLLVRGQGDPLLVSEEWGLICGELLEAGLKEVRDIYLDDSYYDREIVIPGRGESSNPYDATVCALATNFNTIHVRRDSKGAIHSAEPQTPLTPLARELARERLDATGAFRIQLGGNRRRCLRYSGEVLRALLEQQGITVRGTLRIDASPPGSPTLLLRHRSSKTLAQVVAAMLEYSSNFVANQILLNLGALREEPPATLARGLRVLRGFLEERLGLRGYRIVEGSGLSHENRLTARQMGLILQAFRPYSDLMPLRFGVRAKTGTLSVARTLAGYLPGSGARDPAFVLLLGGKNHNRRRIVELLLGNLGRPAETPRTPPAPVSGVQPQSLRQSSSTDRTTGSPTS
jgi:D-alanyl-D-alanine carboxypeptidase/D-alanyl-D-alanine-endopeptidase (penicillin-binding protein 4)